MAHIIQNVVVDGLPDVSHRPLHVGRSDDLMSPRRVLICCQDANFSPGHLLLVDVHCLMKAKEKTKTRWQSARKIQKSRLWFDYMRVIKQDSACIIWYILSCIIHVLCIIQLKWLGLYILKNLNWHDKPLNWPKLIFLFQLNAFCSKILEKYVRKY